MSSGAVILVSIAVALGKPQRALLAGGSPGESAYLKIHEPLSGKTDYLAQHIGVRTFSRKLFRFIMSSVISVVLRSWG